MSDFARLEPALCRILGTVAPPPYEQTADTGARLQALVADHHALEQALQARREAASALEALLAADATALDATLRANHFDPDAPMPKQAAFYLDALTELALALESINVSTPGLMAAVTARDLNECQMLEALVDATAHADTADRLVPVLASYTARLDAALAEMRPALADTVTDHAAFTKSLVETEGKAEEYAARTAALSSSGSGDGATSLAEIHVLADAVHRVDAETRALDNHLVALAGIPPDLLLAQLELDKEKQILDDLIREREDLLLEFGRGLMQD
ncbi:hypothetical protein BC828DRAFT_405256 [Blastocladiella britannica]|nr:hypothetical protein BC828DRAFT_405256 [Blastocladiella britannica]